MKKLIKKLLIVTVVVAMVVTAMPLSGIEFEEITKLFTIESEAAAIVMSDVKFEGLYYYRDISGEEDFIEDGNTIESGSEIVKYMGSEENVVIPSELGGKPVVSINHEAFCPDTLTASEINSNKYNSDYLYVENTDCALIKSVTIPETVYYIGCDVFKNCTSLEKVEFIGEGIGWIDESAFENTALTEIDIPRTLKGIGYGCFKMTEITDIVFGKNDDNYFEPFWGAFEGSKIKTVTFKSDGILIDHFAFNGSNIETIIFEGSVEKFHKNALSSKNNPVQEIIFKSTYPADAARMLILDYGYNCYNYPDYVCFSKKIPADSETIMTDEYSCIVKDNYATIIDYFGTSGVVEIPETINGYTVNRISDTAFMNFSHYDEANDETVLLTSVKIPSTVKEIGGYAFAKNSSLSTVEFESGLEKIGVSAFQDCEKLYHINLPDTVSEIGEYCFANSRLFTFNATGIRKIGANAFEKCEVLTTVVLSDEMESIGTYAFSECRQLGSITVPEGITVIKPYTFNLCTRLSTVNLPESIKEIGESAFYWASGLHTVTNTKFIETLGKNAFYNASHLENFDFSSVKGEIPDYCFYENSFHGKTVVIPSTVERIGTAAFKESEMSGLVISEGVKEIGAAAFESIDWLKEVSIPSSVEVISRRCFYGCPITKLELNEGLKKICEYAFGYAKLEELTIPESVEEIQDLILYNGKVQVLNFNAVNCTYTGESDYEPMFFWNVFEVNIGNKVESLPDFFLYETAISKLTVPENVKSIGKYAFAGCEKLTEVHLPDTLEVLGNHAFRSCTVLTEFTIPKNLKVYYAGVLESCINLETINYNAINCDIKTITGSATSLPYSPFASNTLKSLKYFNIDNSVESIPDYLCSGLTNVEQITIPSAVINIGTASFYKCAFTEIELPSKLESIGEYAFSETQLKSIDLPESLLIINRYAFTKCRKLESVDMKNGVIYLGDDVFNTCTVLKTVTLSENINTIPNGLFRYCDSLEEICIPDNVVRIGENAFQSCDALVNVHMSPNVSYIADKSFYDCAALNEFTWESDSKLIGRLAFGNCTNLKDFNFVGIEKLYDNSFKNSGVSVVTLGEAKNEELAKLTEIETQSFMDCDNLATLGIGGNVTTIKTQAFANCENLETAVIADSVTEIAEDAFDGCDKLTIYCAENSYAHSYAQTQGIRVSTLVIAPIPNQTYTGFEIKPEISVSASGDTLDKNIDFSVSYANNINVGNADVTVKGMGDFRMFASRAKFTIVTKNISAATVSPIADQPYTGSAVTPEITVTDGLKVLSEGKDYTVTFSNNVNEGTATATITGKGNYSGTATTNFQISKDAEEPGFFAKIFSSISSFFARVISFFASIFM
mgnify:CR=1 FL=1